MRNKYALGTMKATRTRAERLGSFLRGLGWTIAVLSIVAGVLSLVQAIWHPFDAIIERVTGELLVVDATLSKDTMGGISFGSFALVAAVAAVPLLGKGVRKRQYALSFWRGLLSSAIFLASDKFYRFVLDKGAFYFSATILLFLAATIVLVEIVSRAARQETETETRTELLASIVSGLVFGILIQFVEFGSTVVKGYVGGG